MNSFEHDVAVQATNDDAQTTKVNAVERGYYEDPFVRYFARKGSRKSPLINRGTWVRVQAVYDSVDRFLEIYRESSCRQIVSLGSGFDSLYFQLQKKSLFREGDRFLDVDYDSVISKKVEIIRTNHELRTALRADLTQLTNTCGARTDQYVLAGVDLRVVEDLKRVAEKVAGFSLEAPTLVICELVLIYMEPKHSDAVLNYLSSSFTELLLFNFEQVGPEDPFGKQMTKNIEARGSPLMGLSAYPSAQSQKERFQKLNFNKVAAISMLEYYSKCAESLQDNVKLRIRVFLVLELIRMVKLVQEMLIQLFPMVAQVCKRI
uniref:Leucine carboxyl methyltransferase 1 n=2 Tax=Rhodosorus marinus TaxID=101924 RepID=A0A7S2ZJP3_9RHOD|mmetsp:Transcript_21814/g.88854  ORF Transcript_21814/g.88854 Transcript_21814/m.88854 type:complete len:319 (+) Transcript_21814:175-1131(+)